MSKLHYLWGIPVMILMGILYLLVHKEDPVIGLDDVREEELRNRDIK